MTPVAMMAPVEGIEPQFAIPLDDLREVLRECEWATETSAGVPQCPVCCHCDEVVSLGEHGTVARAAGHHADDCKLAALLSRLGEAG